MTFFPSAISNVFFSVSDFFSLDLGVMFSCQGHFEVSHARTGQVLFAGDLPYSLTIRRSSTRDSGHGLPSSRMPNSDPFDLNCGTVSFFPKTPRSHFLQTPEVAKT